ncbi:MAG: SDR family NAD(P)-dependent oxidoreductase [bacterium]
MPKAIIIGATSGIGEALARELLGNGYILGLTGRRIERLEEFHRQHPESTHVKPMDVAQPSEAIHHFQELIEEMGGVDLIVINSGVGFINPDLKWEHEKQTIDVNVSGFTAIAGAAMQYSSNQGSGHIVGISSVAALRGNGGAPAYCASKAFISNYLQGLRQKTAKMKIPVHITDIKPGFVDTPMTRGQEGMFWVASADKAAKQIHSAIQKRKTNAYVTKRWRLIAWLFRMLPDWIYNRL